MKHGSWRGDRPRIRGRKERTWACSTARDVFRASLMPHLIPSYHPHTLSDERFGSLAPRHMFNFGGELFSLPNQPPPASSHLVLVGKSNPQVSRPCPNSQPIHVSFRCTAPANYQTLMGTFSRRPSRRPTRLQEAKTASCTTCSCDLPFP